MNHDYSVVNQCATGGYLYEANTENELKEKLNDIANDIKTDTFCDYQAARLIE